MSEPKFTPGPWHRLGHSVHPLRTGTYVLTTIAECKRRAVGPSKISLHESTANGDLIAAAPDLFKELDAVREFDEHIGWCPYCDAEARQFCPDSVVLLMDGYERRRAAIKKARGEK